MDGPTIQIALGKCREAPCKAYFSSGTLLAAHKKIHRVEIPTKVSRRLYSTEMKYFEDSGEDETEDEEEGIEIFEESNENQTEI